MPLPYQDATQVVTNNGLRTQYGIILPPGAKVAAYVRSTGIQNDGNDAFLSQNLVTTLAAGLARVRAGFGDFVVCLPGHTENVTDATTFSNALVTGTKIIGVGRGSNTPTFTWATSTAAQWLVAVNDVVITGLRLQLAGPAGVGNNTILPLTVTGNDFGFYFNEVETGNGTGNAVTAMSVTGTATRFDISSNFFRNASFGNTNCLVISSTGRDGRIADNEMLAGTVTTNGLINVTGAAVNLKILRNYINNFTASSVAGIVLANVAISGQCAYNNITVLNTGAVVSGTTGITIGAAVTMGFFQNFVVNDVLKSGLLLPTVDT